LLPGATQLTVASAFPPVAVTPVGADGTVAGVTGFDCAEAALLPTAFVATTVKTYAVPLLRPDTVAEVAVAEALTVSPPGEEVTV